MGLSRRIFTKEFKVAAVQRLERGASVGEVATGAGGEPERAAPLAAGGTRGAGEHVPGARQAAVG